LLSAIDLAAHELCLDWISNVAPNVSTQLKQSILGINRNVITVTDLDRIEKEQQAPGLFAQLFSRGMFGIPTKAKTGDHYLMNFRPPNGGEHDLPSNFTYGALHPALSAHICKIHPKKDDLLDFYSNVFVVGQGLPCPRTISDPKLRLHIKNGDLRLETNCNGVSRILILNDPTQFMGGATSERRHIAAELLCTLILCVFRQELNSSIRQDNLMSEELYVRNIGLLQTKWGKSSFEAYISGHLFGKAKFELFSEMNKVIGPSLGLKIKQSDPDDSIEEISLCWGQGNHAQSWNPVKPIDIEVAVSQKRQVIEPN